VTELRVQEEQEAGTGAALRHQLKLIDLVMLGAGTAIGATIFSVLGPAAQVGHEGLLIAVGLAAIPMAIFALVYAYMASAVPRTAASYEWQREFSSPLMAFSIVWMRVISNAVVMVILSQVLVRYLSKVVDLPMKPAMFGFFVVVGVLNYLGVVVAARVQTALMILLLVALGILVVAAAPSFQPGLFVKAVGGGWGPILAALPLMIQLFLGIETATEVGGEVADAKHKVPLGVALSLLLTAVVYVSVAFAAMSLIGADGLAKSDTPLLLAAQRAVGHWAPALIVTAAAVSLVKSMNAVFLVYTRFLYAMGVSGVLPSVFARVHPRFGTPYVAILVAFAASAACLLLPSSLLFLLLAVNVPTMLKYFGSCLAAYNVAIRRPDVQAQATLRFSPGLVKALSLLGMAAAIAIGALGLSTDWRPYVLLLAWLLIGLAYYFIRARRRGAVAVSQ
jgi:APA family basic amino acid/polyamine antiporter